MHRREFLVRLGQTALTLPIAIQAIGCGEEDPVAPGNTGTDFNVTSSSNGGHTHNAGFTCQGLSTAGNLTIRSSSNSGHTHELTLDPDEVARVLGGESVAVSSTVAGGHTHTWTIQKPANLCV